MVPGPVSLHPDVITALAKDYGSGQVEEEFMSLYHATGRLIARLMGTKNEIVFMSGEGMLGLWGALKSCLAPGDAVICVGTGVFGDGTADMARSMGCRVESISEPYNTTITEKTLEKVEAATRRLHPVMLTAVHCETPSGTLNPLEGLGQLKKDLGIPLFYVDTVSAFGGVPVHADKWNVDLILGGSQKCLSAPPSMSMVGVSEPAWERMKAVGYQGYDAIAPFRTVREDGRCPYTPNWHGMAALHAAAEALFAEGLEHVYARHEEAAALCRSGLAELGIALWTAPQAINSPTVTAAMIPNKYSWSEWRQRLRARGLVCTGSFGPMAGKVFRLGHMGTQAHCHLVRQALEAIADAL